MKSPSASLMWCPQRIKVPQCLRMAPRHVVFALFLSRFGRKEQFLIINFSQKQLLADSPDPPWDAIYKCKGAVTRVTQRHFSQGGCHLWALWLLFSIFFENLRPIHSFAHFSQILCCCIAAFSWISSSAVGRNVPSSCRFAKQFEVSFHALV